MGIAGGTNIAIGGSGWTPSRRGQPVIAATAAAKHDGASVPKTHAMFFWREQSRGWTGEWGWSGRDRALMQSVSRLLVTGWVKALGCGWRGP